MGEVPLYHSADEKGVVPTKFEGHVTKLAPHKALKLIARGELTLDGRVVFRRAGHYRGYSKLRIRTAPRVVLCSLGLALL